MYLLLILIFILFLITQLILAIGSWNLNQSLVKKFSKPLGSQVEITELLDKYIKKDNLKLKASSKIDNIAAIDGDLFLINKKYLYKKDLFSNFYVIFILNLYKSAGNLLINLHIYQNLLFLAQFSFLILGLIFQNYSIAPVLIIGAIVTQLTLYGVCFAAISKLDLITKKTTREAKKLLKLDNVEEARAEVLGSNMKYLVFEYPFDIVWRVIHFLS